MTDTYIPFTPREDLALKISIRETRAKHARGARKAEELRALASLKERLAALEAA